VVTAVKLQVLEVALAGPAELVANNKCVFMERLLIEPRANWQQKVEAIGFNYHSIDNTYWNESAYYKLTLAEVNAIETATQNIYQLCLEAVQYVIDKKLYAQFAIPNFIIPFLEDSWNNDAPSIYGRLDLCVKNDEIKLLEFNADTPTSLFEAAIVQWYWLNDFDKTKDQFNSIHEKLVNCWRYLKNYLYNAPLHFTCVENSVEDEVNTAYLRDCAMQAGLATKQLFINDIGVNSTTNYFTDLEEQPIKNIFKLYPWEWLLEDEFANYIASSSKTCNWLEPPWKMILSNKAILPILWQLFPKHENLLQAGFKADGMHSYAKKPIFSREGANITLVKNNTLLDATQGEYGKEGYIFQQLCELPKFNNKHAVVGSWLIGQEAAGIGIRESGSLVTNNSSQFVPHLIG
jgi:glutathionylspermidine synthase